MAMTDLIINMDEPRERAMIIDKVRNLSGGMFRFMIGKYRKRRTDRQNRFYWPAFVAPFADFMRSHGHAISDDDAHEILKYQFLRRSIIDRSGELMEYTRSTTSLDTQEFNQYLDQCAAFLANYAGIIVPEPDVYRERAEVPI